MHIRLTCPWCEDAPLRLVDVRRDAPNGAGSAALVGVALACAGLTACPDTTGACKTVAEAEGYAKELGAQPWIGDR
jgi:hypothetical protein